MRNLVLCAAVAAHPEIMSTLSLSEERARAHMSNKADVFSEAPEKQFTTWWGGINDEPYFTLIPKLVGAGYTVGEAYHEDHEFGILVGASSYEDFYRLFGANKGIKVNGRGSPIDDISIVDQFGPDWLHGQDLECWIDDNWGERKYGFKEDSLFDAEAYFKNRVDPSQLLGLYVSTSDSIENLKSLKELILNLEKNS